MSSNEQRDELARIALDVMYPASTDLPDDPMTWPVSVYKTAAAILAAGYRKVDPADEVAVDKVALALTLSDGWLSVAHPSPRHQAELRKRAQAILAVLHEPTTEATK